jgi:hypothetical protein
MREKRGARGVRETLGHGGNGMSFFWREGGGREKRHSIVFI